VTFSRALHLEKHSDRTRYEPLGDGIYRRLIDGQVVLAVTLELEPGELTYLVVEGVMLEFRVSSTGDTSVGANGDQPILNLELEGSGVDPAVNLANLRRLAALVGLRSRETVVSELEAKVVYEREVEPGRYEVVHERWVDHGLHRHILE
jgi:hypothetical protein